MIIVQVSEKHSKGDPKPSIPTPKTPDRTLANDTTHWVTVKVDKTVIIFKNELQPQFYQEPKVYSWSGITHPYRSGTIFSMIQE